MSQDSYDYYVEQARRRTDGEAQRRAEHEAEQVRDVEERAERQHEEQARRRAEEEQEAQSVTERQENKAVIRTPDRRLRVFVSSALGELADERRAVSRAISALRLTPVMFEQGARPHPPRGRVPGLPRAQRGIHRAVLAALRTGAPARISRPWKRSSTSRRGCRSCCMSKEPAPAQGGLRRSALMASRFSGSRPGGGSVAEHMLFGSPAGEGAGRHRQDRDCRCWGRRPWCWASAVRGWPRGDGPGTRRRGAAGRG